MIVPADRPENFRYGWFSKKQAAHVAEPSTDHVLHIDGPPTTMRVPGRRFFGRIEDGTEVEISHQTEGPDHGTGWDDIEFVDLVRLSTIRGEDVGPLDAPVIDFSRYSIDIYKVPCNLIDIKFKLSERNDGTGA